MKNFIRTISFIVVTVLILSSVLPVSIYASSVITGGEGDSTVVGAKTGPEDVTMQATSTETLRESVKKVLNIPVTIDVYNSSYIKDASISFENSNFNVAVSEIATNKNVQSVRDDVIKLNSSEIDEKIELTIPVLFKKAEYVAEDYFNRAVTIKLSGKYVDKNGEEKNFSKTTQASISWFVPQRDVVANAEVVRSFDFNENGTNKLMVTLKLTSGIADGAAAEKQKTIEVNVPRITNIYPQVFVSADKYEVEENQSSGKITLIKNVEKNDSNEYKWENESDVIYVTYIYSGIGNNVYSDVKDVRFRSRIFTIDSPENGLANESNGVEIPLSKNDEIDDIIIANAISTNSINRGYIISNIGMETEFNVRYTMNIGYDKMLKDITVRENQNEYSSAYRTKTVSVNSNELTRILGDNGKITVSLKNSSDTYEINKNNTTITIPTGKEISQIVTSKPQGVGNLSLNLTKALNNNASETLKGKDKIVGETTIINTDLENKQSMTTCQWQTEIEEPTQKVQFESKFKTMSTIKKNEKMVLSIVLESDSIDDYLYKNPSLKITYPEAIKTISNVTANVLYDDYNEIKLTNTNIDNDNRNLVLTFSGTQTHYVTSAVSKGVLIQITADYTLDRLAPTKDSTIQLEIHNGNTNQITTLQKDFRTIAPTEFILQNKVEVTSPSNSNGTSDKNYFKETRETIAEDVEDIIVPLYSNSKYIDVYGTVVNNQGTDVDNVAIVGNIPSKGSKSYSGTDFESTFDTEITAGIRVIGEIPRTAENEKGTYRVYYSTNANEQVNSDNWTESVVANAKSYKIVFLGKFKNTDRKDFYYRVKTPEDMTYGEKIKEAFALLYGNNSVSGEQYSYVESRTIGIATKQEADFDVNTTVKDYITGKEIKNGDDIDEGEYLKIDIAITNISNRKINNVKAIVELTDELAEFRISSTSVDHNATGNIERIIGEINASETKKITATVYVDVVREIRKNSINLEDDNTENDAIYSKMNIKIFEGNELEFKPLEYKNRINFRKLAGITVSKVQDGEISIDDKFQQKFYIRNETTGTINNIEIKGKLPKGIDYDTDENNAITIKGLTYTYNPDTREYKIKIDKVENYDFVLGIPLNLKAVDYGTFVLESTVSAEDETLKFNDIEVVVANKARNFEVSHKISTPTNTIKDTDTFNFTVTIRNHWTTEKIVTFNDRLDNDFIVYGYEIFQNDQELTKHENVNLIDYVFTMQPNDYVEIRIKCGVKTQAVGTTINLTHRPKAKCGNVDIIINPITVNVVGTGNFINTNDPIINGKYSVSGTAWLDTNNNGRREETETKISNITMKLMDNNTNLVVVDDEGNEKITTTDNNGEYIFNNIPVGSYVVVAYYDSEKYGCGDYKNRNVADDLNNDFMEIDFEGHTVGATDNIIIQNTNAYAIDISLIPRDTFDMAIEKKVSSVLVKTSTGKEANYKFNSELAKIEISNEKGVEYYLTIEYSLIVKNIGYIDGYAKSIVDFIPKGMEFVQEDNPGWYMKADGYAYNDTLSNALIKAQNQVEIKIKLRKSITAEQTGIIKNSTELDEIYNLEGIEDINSKAANRDSSENDYSEALVVIALSTGGRIIQIAGILFGLLTFGIVTITFIKYRRKKRII